MDFRKTLKYRKTMSIACSGEKNGMYGKKHKESSIEKMRLKALKRWQDPEYRRKTIENRDIENYRLAQKRKWQNPSYKKKQSKAISISKKGKKWTEVQVEARRRYFKTHKAWNYGYGDYMRGSKNPMYGKKAWNSGLTKADHPSIFSQSQKVSGSNCHWWKDAHSYEPYDSSWNNELRSKIRKRDNYICQLCGIRQDKLKGFIKKLIVHHIDYNKKNNKPKNLIALCQPCHSKTNCNRDYWILYFKSLQA